VVLPVSRSVPQDGKATTLLDVKPQQCRWIEGEINASATMCCGHPVAEVGAPYCQRHLAIAWAGKPAPKPEQARVA
jgi:hypothetical protein